MKNLFFACCLLAYSVLPAQTTVFAPDGATWWYRPWTPGNELGLYSFTATGDTLLDGWNARVLQCSVWDTISFHPVDSLTKYVAVTGAKVYHRVAGEFVLLFDFEAQPGDTIGSKVESFAIDNGCVGPAPGQVWDFRYRIDSVGLLVINGVELRVQHVTSISNGGFDPEWSVQGYMSGRIVERIGTLGTGYWWGQGNICILGGTLGYLRCYDDMDIHFTAALDNLPCNFINSATEPAVKTLELYPNPASDFVLLPFAPDDLQVFDLLGHCVLSQSGGENTLDLSALPAGPYSVLALYENHLYRGNLLVLE